MEVISLMIVKRERLLPGWAEDAGESGSDGSADAGGHLGAGSLAGGAIHVTQHGVGGLAEFLGHDVAAGGLQQGREGVVVIAVEHFVDHADDFLSQDNAVGAELSLDFLVGHAQGGSQERDVLEELLIEATEDRGHALVMEDGGVGSVEAIGLTVAVVVLVGAGNGVGTHLVGGDETRVIDDLTGTAGEVTADVDAAAHHVDDGVMGAVLVEEGQDAIHDGMDIVVLLGATAIGVEEADKPDAAEVIVAGVERRDDVAAAGLLESDEAHPEIEGFAEHAVQFREATQGSDVTDTSAVDGIEDDGEVSFDALAVKVGIHHIRILLSLYDYG